MSKAEEQSTTSDTAYQQEVLGKRVEIMFDDGTFYPGIIRRLHMEFHDDETMAVQHFVEFDDGDTRWFDLRIEEQHARLRWPSIKREAKREAAASSVSPPTKKQKTKPKKAVKFEENEIPHAEPHDEDEKNRQSSQDDPSRQGVPVPVPNSLPKSITAIIHYMDELEPDKNYYARQADSRDGCSKIRKKIRKFAKRNPDHPAVKHYTETKDWQPPDEKALKAMIELIKTMIK